MREIFGSIATVRVDGIDEDIIAKVDTGAWSGALHCTNIYEKDGCLHFTPLGNPRYQTKLQQFETRSVRSASGHAEKRYIVPFTLEIDGQVYHTTLGLSDRTLMKREMLIGRKFLLENHILVDVSLTIDDDHEAELFL